LNITTKYSQTEKGLVVKFSIMGLAFYAYSPPFSSLLFLFFLPSLHSLHMHQGRIQGGDHPPITYESNFFPIILYTSENSICDIRLFCRPMFYHSSVVKYAFISLTVAKLF